MRRFGAFLLAGLCLSCTDFLNKMGQDMVQSSWSVNKDLVSEPPQQTPTTETGSYAFKWEKYDVEITPRAEYSIRALVVATDEPQLDRWTGISPVDLGLAWGAAADPEFLKLARFRIDRRYLTWHIEGPEGGNWLPKVKHAMSNNHLIPSDDDIRSQLKQVEIGEIVELKGLLVDMKITHPNGKVVYLNRSSLSRTDKGSGACEQILVRSVKRMPAT